MVMRSQSPEGLIGEQAGSDGQTRCFRNFPWDGEPQAPLTPFCSLLSVPEKRELSLSHPNYFHSCDPEHRGWHFVLPQLICKHCPQRLLEGQVLVPRSLPAVSCIFVVVLSNLSPYPPLPFPHNFTSSNLNQRGQPHMGRTFFQLSWFTSKLCWHWAQMAKPAGMGRSQ